MSRGEDTRRFAICNMDWDNMRAVDILAVMQSFKPATGRQIETFVVGCGPRYLLAATPWVASVTFVTFKCVISFTRPARKSCRFTSETRVFWLQPCCLLFACQLPRGVVDVPQYGSQYLFQLQASCIPSLSTPASSASSAWRRRRSAARVWPWVCSMLAEEKSFGRAVMCMLCAWDAFRAFVPHVPLLRLPGGGRGGGGGGKDHCQLN